MEIPSNIFELIKKKLSKFEKYKIRYKDGFYQIPNLSNTPQSIIASFDKMYFCKHDKEKGTLSSNSFFLNANSYYREIEPDLWLFHSKIHYKKNVAFTFKPDPSIEANYYIIKLYLQKSSCEKTMLLKGFPQVRKVWSAYKSNDRIVTHHFKHTEDISMMLHFSSEWFKNKLKTDAHLVDSGFIHFIESKDPLLSLEEKEELTDYFSTKYLNYLQMANSPDKQEKLKQLSKQFFDCFIEKYKCERLEKNHFEINDSSRKSIKQIEKYLMECLPNSFPGIEKISKKMGISPTKLKHDFKIIHQQSIFQFYRQKQMELAYQILSEDKILIKELANQMGYTSIGKFSSAFRNQFGVLPSKALKM